MAAPSLPRPPRLRWQSQFAVAALIATIIESVVVFQTVQRLQGVTVVSNRGDSFANGDCAFQIARTSNIIAAAKKDAIRARERASAERQAVTVWASLGKAQIIPVWLHLADVDDRAAQDDDAYAGSLQQYFLPSCGTAPSPPDDLHFMTPSPSYTRSHTIAIGPF